MNAQTVQSISVDLLTTFAHSLWQGTLIAAAVALTLRWLPARACDRRYLIACSGLLLLVVCSFATWSIVRQKAGAKGRQTIAAAQNDSHVDETARGSAENLPNSETTQKAHASGDTDASWISSVSPALIVIWCFGAVLMLFRAGRGFWTVNRWVGAARTCGDESASELQNQLRDLQVRMGIRQRVEIYVSEHVPSPAVIGNFWPVILMPVSILSEANLTSEQIRIILAHELAHIRRLDGLVNFAQLIIESLLFFNPAVWWLGKSIRDEREACCDAIAARINESRGEDVARTLVHIASSFASENPRAALSFSSPGSLRDRVFRLLKPDQSPERSSMTSGLSWLGTALSLSIVCGTLLLLQQGTSLAVQTAVAILDKDDVDEMARRQAIQANVFAPPAVQNGEAKNEDVKNIQPKNTKVTLVVKTENGEPIKGKYNVSYSHVLPGRSMHGNLTNGRGPRKEIRTSHEFNAGLIRIGISAEGFAPAITKEITLMPGQETYEFDVVLTRGFETKVRIVDEAARNVDGIQVDVNAWMIGSSGGSTLAYQSRKLPVDDGIVTIDRLHPDVDYEFKIRVPGWENSETKLKLRADETPTWKIYRAKPTKINLVDDESGQPVQNAKVILAGWNEIHSPQLPDSNSGDPRSETASSQPELGISDKNGEVTIVSLSRKRKSCLAVLADGYQMAIVRPVFAGKDIGEIRLKKELVVSGQITGDLTKLPTWRYDGKSKRVVKYRNPPPELGFSDLFHVRVANDGRFEIRGLQPGKFELQLVGYKKRLDLKTSIDLQGVPITAEPKTEPSLPVSMRKVEFGFKGLPDGLLARGSWEVSWQNGSDRGSKTVPVENNLASVEVPAGSRVWAEPTGLVGIAIEDPKPVELSDGEEPFRVSVKAVPAGSVDGNIFRHDGQPAISGYARVFMIEPAPNSDGIQLNSSVTHNASRFFRSLPLGGTYVVLASEDRDRNMNWAISDPINPTVDEPINKLTIKLPKPQPIKVLMTDKVGQPVANAPVNLGVHFSFSGMNSRRTISVQTDENGKAEFWATRPEHQRENLNIEYSIVAPRFRDFVGQKQIVNFDDSETVLSRVAGYQATGRVIDSVTGRPIPNAKVVLWPKDSRSTTYNEFPSVKSDEKGVFRFQGLELIEYYSRVDDTVPPGTIVTPRPNGGHSTRLPDFYSPTIVIPGDETEFDLEVQIMPGKKLKPLEN